LAKSPSDRNCASSHLDDAVTIGADWKAAFGDSPEPADELAVLVLFGIKTATCWAVSDGASTHVGKRMVVWLADREPAAVIETVEVTLRFTAHITLSLRAGEWSFGGDGAAVLHHCYGDLSC
jgi:uncharacterized protein YhfF